MKTFMKDELIGLEISVVESSNPSLVGLKGIVVDETMSTLIIKGDRRRTLIKSQIVFETEYNNKKLRVAGIRLTKRPEERIKTR